MIYVFELGNKAAEAIKNICVKSKESDDHTVVIRWFKKFRSSVKNLENKARSDKPKSANSKTVVMLCLSR